MKDNQDQLPTLTLDEIKRRHQNRSELYEVTILKVLGSDAELGLRMVKIQIDETTFLLDLIERLSDRAKGFNDRLDATPLVQSSGVNPTD